MLTARMRIQVIAFVVIALCATAYLSVKYVGLNLFGSGYHVTMSLPQGGGTFENGEVTYRGVPVGRIESMKLTDDGMEAVLRIDSDAPDIPADVTVNVANRSAIGEQYVDLRGESTEGGLLEDGDHLEGGNDALPPSIDELLRTGRDFVASVPKDDLNTVLDETYLLSKGANRHLPRLIETSQEFSEIADRNFLVTKGLIENSSIVLDTQKEAAASMRAFSRDLGLIATTMAETDAPLRKLIENTPAAAMEVHRLFEEVGAPLGQLMSNLVSTAQIFGVNSMGVEDTLIRLPEAISVGYVLNGSQGLDLGLAQTYFDPLPCTAGYEGTRLRAGLETSKGRPFNQKAGCRMDPSSGTNVRGPKSIRVASGLADLLGGTS